MKHPKLRKAQKAAMKNYYVNRALARKDIHDPLYKQWSRMDDIKKLFEVILKDKRVYDIGAVAGTFFVYWKRGIKTVHSEKNYWIGKGYKWSKKP